MTIVLDTPEQIEAYRLISIRSALAIEVRGMKFSNRVNVFQQAKAVLTAAGIKPKGNKPGVWVQLDDYMVSLGIPRSQRPPV